MKIKNMNLNRAVCAGLFAGTMVLCGCGKVTADDPIYFNNVEAASAKTYYEITVDDQDYFIGKSDLAVAIPEPNETFPVGLRVDEDGNTIAVEYEEIEDGDIVISCRLDDNHNMEDGTNYAVYIDDVDGASKVNGYRIKIDGVVYDVSKDDVVDGLNGTGFSIFSDGGYLSLGNSIDFEANPNGGKDTVKVM